VLSAKNAWGEALSMEASREVSRTPPRVPPCSDLSVLQNTRLSHVRDTHHMARPPKRRHRGNPFFARSSGCLHRSTIVMRHFRSLCVPKTAPKCIMQGGILSGVLGGSVIHSGLDK